mgnify:CR=1 FL=1|tara:strand:+ start:260 stop:388 length:129 start_codon:yes stop_codon:yes gene_type:complete
MQITDVKTVPAGTAEIALGAFIEIHIDTELVGIGETYKGACK